MEDLSQDAAEFYRTSAVVTPTQAAEIAHDAGQDNPKWQRERLLRITGSKSHSLFRFQPSEERTWEKKVIAMLTYNFQGNAATRHAKSCENLALQEYVQKTGQTVSSLGLVINAAVP
ncbi:hypothetical protein HPB50_006378 [Hyalomma asiaticum]|uniref:Uncharacterized protein n=1 Tax=Hyalomma asiaticum TaxID=266040 RepID=A0ACB7SQW0_HYAAI|nr:hypothetical protein HPB50_006378 [Hyalomma asiaticum]